VHSHALGQIDGGVFGLPSRILLLQKVLAILNSLTVLELEGDVLFVNVLHAEKGKELVDIFVCWLAVFLKETKQTHYSNCKEVHQEYLARAEAESNQLAAGRELCVVEADHIRLGDVLDEGVRS